MNNLSGIKNDLGQEELSEASLSRVLRQVESGEGFVILSASRGERSKTDNRQQNQQLASILLDRGHGFSRISGRFTETSTPEGSTKEVRKNVEEDSFFASDVSRAEAIAIAKLAYVKFQQEQIVWGITQTEDNTEEAGIFLLDGKTGKEIKIGTKVRITTIGDALTQVKRGKRNPNVKNSRFTFEGLEYRPYGFADYLGWTKELEELL